MSDTINKFVGVDAETRKQTIIAFITALIDFLSAFHIIEFTDEQVQAIYKMALCLVTAIVWGYCSHWKNNNFTEEARTGTIIAREMKELAQYAGETVDEPEDSSIEEGGEADGEE